MAPRQIEKMSMKELLELKLRVETLIQQRKQQERAALMEKMRLMAAEAGFSIEELFGGKLKKGGAVAPKYVHPEDPTLTWSGRGRKPNWLVEAIDDGYELQDFAVSS